MKIYYSKTSPYARKVRLVVFEKGLRDQVELILTNPNENNSELISLNPLSQIPTLVLADDQVLFDSPVICNYLDSLPCKSHQRLVPEDKDQQLFVHRWHAMSDGLIDATYSLVMERRRPTSEQSPTWIADKSAVIERVLQVMDNQLQELVDLPHDVSLAHLTVASAVGYIELRLPEFLDKTIYTQLLNWYEKIKTRNSMIETQPA